MIIQNVISRIEANTGSMAMKWADKVRKTENMKTYQRDIEKLIGKNEQIYKFLVLWLQKEKSKDEIGSFFFEMGKDYFNGSYALSQINYAFFLAKMTVREDIFNEQVIETSLAFSQIMELIIAIHDFFFLAAFYVIKGYHEGMYHALSGKHGVSAELLDQVFHDDFFFKSPEFYKKYLP